MNAPIPFPVQSDRRTYLGGSDCAAILGVSPWATPLDVFLEKTGQKVKTVDLAREKLFRRGKRLEPVVVDMLIEDEGVKVTKRSTPAAPNRYLDAEHDFLAAEIDFEWEVTPEVADKYDLPEHLVGTIQNGEVKTVHPFAAAGKFGDESTDEIPIEYGAQAAHGLMVTRRELTMFAVLTGADNLTLYFFHRDADTERGIRAKELAFWARVQRREAPAPHDLPDIYQLFGIVPAIRVEASIEIGDLVHQLNDLRAAERVAAQGQEEVKFRIGEFMLGKDAIVLTERGRAEPGQAPKLEKHILTLDGVTVLEVGLKSQARLDGDKVKKDFPEVAEKCVKTISFYVFAKPPEPKAPRRKK